MSDSNKTNVSSSGSTLGNKKPLVLGVMTFAIMNVTTIISLKGLPAQAEYGLTSIFYYLFAAFFFLIPVALVAAELASTYPKKGGIFRWVSEAFGTRVGFAAIYYQWQAIAIWFPTILIFGSVALAFIWWPETFDAHLASDKIYIIITLLAIYWLATLNTFRGLKSSTKLSTLGGLFGTIIPAGILIILGVIYLIMGKPVYLPLHQSFFPDFSNFDNLVLASSIFLYFGGMEMQAVHIEHMKNPGKNYPLSILIATIITISIFIACTLAVGLIIPKQDINLVQTLLIAYRDFWTTLHVPWLGNVMAIMVAFGVLGQASVMVAGPSTGLLTVGRAGFLPRKLQKVNKNDIQVPILIVQGIFVTMLTVLLAILPTIQSAFQILSQLATIIYLWMYIIMYVSVLRLRYTAPNKTRPFKIPLGKFGIWFVGCIGLIGAVLAVSLSFVPPSQISIGSPLTYTLILVISVIVFTLIPFIIYSRRKKSWIDPDSIFEPFDYQIEGRKPSQKSKWPKGYMPEDKEESQI